MIAQDAVLLTALAFALQGTPAPPSPGEANGALVVAGRTTPLAHAYAVPQRGGETLLILTDEPLDDKALKDVFERIHRADEGKLHGVEMILDSKKTPISVSIRHDAFRAHGGGYSSAEHFEPRDSGPGVIAGRIYRTEPGEFAGVAYTFDATFTAPLRREPAPTLSGVAARKSPPARAAIAFFKAGRAGDVVGVKRSVVSDRAGDFEGPEGKKLMEAFQLAPDPARATITRVDVRGDEAEVTFVTTSKDSTETSTVKLRLDGGKWKVSP